MDALVAACIVGIVGGIVGSLFIRVNNRVNIIRKKLLGTNKKLKVLEACILVAITATAFFVSAYYRPCMNDNDPTDALVIQKIHTMKFNCPEGQYNRLATLFFNGQATVLKIFMANGNSFNPVNIAIFLGNWIFFTYITSGTAVPLGIFLPCMIIGCAIGHLYHPFHVLMFPYNDFPSNEMNSETISILGAVAVLSGATRMTFCLAVIMLETTSNMDLFLPIIFTLFCSYGSGFIFNSRSIYKGALRSKNIPIINKSVPKVNRNLQTPSFMSSPVISFNFIVSVEQVYYQLSNTSFNGFPVTNAKG
jgi:chloride channel 7